MVHGEPYPATSDPRFTSVGTLALRRFLRLVCYQDAPRALLPESLQDGNPLWPGGSKTASQVKIERFAPKGRTMSGEQKSAAAGRGHVRYLMVFMLFAATTVNYADRASLSIVGRAMQRQPHIGAIIPGYIFQAGGPHKWDAGTRDLLTTEGEL
jgi:hypothetical protein